MKAINPTTTYMLFIKDEILSALRHFTIEQKRKNLPKHLIHEQNVNREKIAEQLFRKHLLKGGAVVFGFDLGDCNNFDEWLKKNKDSIIEKTKRNKEIHLDPQSRDAFNALFMLYQANSHLAMLDALLADFPKFAAKHELSTATQLSFLNKYLLLPLPQKATDPKIYDIFKNAIIGKQSDVGKEVTEVQILETVKKLRKATIEKSNENIKNALSMVVLPLGIDQENRLKDKWNTALKLWQETLSNTDSSKASVEAFNFVETRGLVDQIAFYNSEKLATKEGITLKVVNTVEDDQENSIADPRISPGGGG